MNARPAYPAEPPERRDTVRHEIIEALRDHPRSARDISAAVRISMKEVYDHLEHIRKSLERGEERLVTTPPQCRKCGFIFRKRERLKKPGRCPVCRGESIQEPVFTIRKTS